MTAINVDATRKKVLFSIEVRYPPKARILDCRGHLADELHEKLKDSLEHWRVDSSTVHIQDDLDRPMKSAHIEHRRAYVSYEDVPSFDDYWRTCGVVFEVLFSVLGDDPLHMPRMGMRLICIHDLPQTNHFDAVRRRVQKAYLKDGHPFSDTLKDVRLVLVTPARRIQFGPVSAGEQWVKDSFSSPDTNVPKSGLAIDIDSFSEDVSVAGGKDLLEKLHLLSDSTFTSEKELLDSICGQQE